MPHRGWSSPSILYFLAVMLGEYVADLPAARGQALPPNSPPLSALPGGPPPGAPPVRPGELVVDVIIDGNRATKDYDVQKYIHTRKDREFDPEVINGDVRRLVTSGLFRDVKTSWRQAEGGVVVIFHVEERPRIGQIKFLGNRGLSDKKLGKEIGLKVGEALNGYTAEESRRKLEELYRKEGYPQATVSLMEGDKPGDRDLVFLINEGQLQRIWWVTFDGNTIPEARLETQIQSKAGIGWYLFGGKVDRSKIEADKEKLTAYYRSLGYFRARISAWPDTDEAGKWVTLRFVIDEGPRYKVRSVAVEGNKKFAAEPLLNFLAVKSGNYFNQAEMNKDLNTITDLYGSQGHVFADVQADPRFLEEPGQLDLVYRIKEGDVFKVSEVNVHVAGEFPHTRNTVVLTRLSLLPGDIINSVKVHESERRLKAAQVFETNPAEGDAPRIVIKPPDAMSLGPTVRGQEPDAPSRTSPSVPVPPQPPSPYQPR